MIWKVPFAAADAVSLLKIKEGGMPKEHIAYLATLLTPVAMVVPVAVAKYTAGPMPLNVAMQVYPARMGFTLVAALTVYCVPKEFIFPRNRRGGVLVHLIYGELSDFVD